MRNVSKILILPFLFASCLNNPKQVRQAKNVDNATTAHVRKQIPKVEVSYFKTSKSILLGFQPTNLKINFSTQRPVKSDSIYFCIPAAFTTRQKMIDGLAIEKGNPISSTINNSLDGFVEIKNEEIIFSQFNDTLIRKISYNIIQTKGSLFQQQLLIFDSKIVPCNLFGDKINLRRALVKRNGTYLVIQSLDNITIHDFQMALNEIGVSDAIYLDMGSWSEGWFIDDNGNRQSLGDNFANTQNQTNWLIFKE